MVKIAVTYNLKVKGSSVFVLMASIEELGAEIVKIDFRDMMKEIPSIGFLSLYDNDRGRQLLFAHAKAKARLLLKDIDGLSIPGNNKDIDPDLFNRRRSKSPDGKLYDFSRTVAELALIHVALEKGIPFLGICGGHQLLAVYGGQVVETLSFALIQQQSLMNYELVTIFRNSLLRQIVTRRNFVVSRDRSEDIDYQGEFFGCHTQYVVKPAPGFQAVAVAAIGNTIEAMESLYGVPVLTTQFHPEVAVHGLSNATLGYRKTGPEREKNLNIIKYFTDTAETYGKKRNLLIELMRYRSQCKSPSWIKRSVRLDKRGQPSGINLRNRKIKVEPIESVQAPIQNTGFVERVFPHFQSIIHGVLENIYSMRRMISSFFCTYEYIGLMKKRTLCEEDTSEITSSTTRLLKKCPPREILSNTPAKPFEIRNQGSMFFEEQLTTPPSAGSYAFIPRVNG